MTETTTHDRQGVPNDPSSLYADVEDARTRLGHTVDEIGHRLDVPARLKGAAQGVGHRISETSRRRPAIIGGAGLAAAAAVGIAALAWRRWGG
ncbi:MAG TPA: DUF3618 domain-containing protein [Nocardioidaceae bacterium]|nr:DUF3618 domain-containing protein [Nocardioidaceae bacterium]